MPWLSASLVKLCHELALRKFVFVLPHHVSEPSLTTIQLDPSNPNNLREQPSNVVRPRARRMRLWALKVRLPLPIQLQLQP